MMPNTHRLVCAATLGLALALGAARADPAPPAGVVAVTDLDALRRLWVADPAIHDHVDCGDGLDHQDAAGAPPLPPAAIAAMLAVLSRNLAPR